MVLEPDSKGIATVCGLDTDEAYKSEQFANEEAEEYTFREASANLNHSTVMDFKIPPEIVVTRP